MRVFHGKKKFGIWINATLITLAFGLTGCGSGDQLKKSTGNSIVEDDKYELIQKYIDENYLYEVDEEKEKEEMYRALVAGLDDPYSEYMTAEEITVDIRKSDAFQTDHLLCGIEFAEKKVRDD